MTIKFKDLSTPLKVGIIGGYTYTVILGATLLILLLMFFGVI